MNSKVFSSTCLIFSAFLLSVLGLTACGSGGGSSSKTTNTASATITGQAEKGPISGGTVTAYEITASGIKGGVLKQTTTDANGNYSLTMNHSSGPILLEITGGTFIDEATGATISLPTTSGSGLQAVIGVVGPGSSLHVQITPLTTMAVARAQHMTGGLTAANINAANQQVGTRFGGIDILNTQPINPLVAESATGASQNAINYGLILAGLSQEAKTLGLSNPLDLVSALADDFTDGSFDGQSGTAPVILNGSPMDAATGATGLAAAVGAISADTAHNVSEGTVSSTLLVFLSDASAVSYTIGGMVSGFDGTGFVLQNNGGDPLRVSANGPFTFGIGLANDSPYAVTVAFQPAGQGCNVSHGTGTVDEADVTSVAVVCAASTSTSTVFTIGGTVSGLNGTGLVLQNNGGDPLPVSADGPFTFGTALANDSPYAVTVSVQPAGQNCNVSQDEGTVDDDNVTSVDVVCVTPPPTIPSAPLGVSAASGDGEATISWDPVNGPTDYTIYMASEPGVTQAGYSALSDGMSHTHVTSPFLHTGLLNGTTYYFVVTAVNAVGEGVESGEVFTTPAPIVQGKKVAAGYSHTCAVVTDGTVQCWGDNTYGQLGDGTLDSSGLPRVVSGLSDAAAVAAGSYFTCALLTGGTVECWGENNLGQLGDGTSGPSSVPVVVSGITNAVALSSGNGHTCAVLGDGTIQCWGANGNGQLGNGDTNTSDLPVSVNGITDAVAVSSGPYDTCAVLSGGTIRCWGENGNGQLGDGTTDGSTVPVAVAGVADAKAVSAGQFHTCAVKTDGTAQCWGANYSGQIGDGTTTSSMVPVTVSGLAGAIAITAGFAHTCALLDGGTVKCWGNNGGGQLGNGTTDFSSLPIAVSGITDVIAITAGYQHSCAVLDGGTVKCWGVNSLGKLGNGGSDRFALPVPVGRISDAIGVAPGYSHTCAGIAGGTVKCWGYNYFGQLGNGTKNGSVSPVAVSGITDAVSVSSGSEHTCAALGDGTVKCWGYDYYGQLGNGASGSNATSSVPVNVTGITDALAVAVRSSHSCALLSGGGVKCWGYNGNGQLGNGTKTPSSVPVAVTGIADAVDLSAGGAHVCAILSGGTVQCWGYNASGQLGDGTQTSSSTPVTVSGITDAVAVSAGGNHTCAVLAGGTMRCWGYNFFSQLGDGKTHDEEQFSTVPVTVIGITDAVAVMTGYSYSCAVLAGGTVKCWGGNDSGQLGVGSFKDSKTPTAVSGITGAIAAASGEGADACAVLTGGSIRCWGNDYDGQLGNGTLGYSTLPVSVIGFGGP